MVREILNWTKEKSEEIDITEDKGAMLKAFLLGCIEGAIDTAVIWYPFLLIACIAKNNQLEKLQKK